MDRIELFRIFARVVECSSFTRAADQLGIPRSSVSAAVHELERRIGVRLLNRTTRQVVITDDGAAFYERCIRLVADVDEAESLFRQTDGVSGKLRVDVPGRIGRLIIAPALPDFFAQFPNVELVLGVTDRAVNIVEENIDCVLRVGQLRDSGLIARTIGTLPLINVASPRYLAKYGVPQAPDALVQHCAVRFASPVTGRVEDWEWRSDGVVKTMSVGGRLTVNNAEAYIAAAVAGIGLIQIPAYDVQHQIVTGELVEVLAEFRADPMPMALLYPQRRHLSRRLQVFANWLIDLLKRDVLTGGGENNSPPS